MTNHINHPSHYTQGRIECIDYIEDQNFNYRIGCAIKYLARYRHKDSPIEDLHKAMWYINREIVALEAENPIIDEGDYPGKIKYL